MSVFILFSAKGQITSNFFGGCWIDEAGRAIRVGPHIYVVGWTKSFNWGDGDVYLFKTDTSGNAIWAKTYRAVSGLEQGLSISAKPNGNLLVTASLPQSSGIMELDSSGNIQWSKGFSNFLFPFCTSTFANGAMSSFTDNGVAGWVCMNDTGMVTDEYRIKAGFGTFGSYPDGTGFFNDFFSTKDSGYVAIGDIEDSLIRRPFILRFDKSGQPLWIRNYTHIGLKSRGIETRSGYLVSSNFGLNPAPYFKLMKTDATGKIQWVKKYQSPNIDFSISSPLQLTDGSYVITGWVDSSYTWGATFAARLDTLGNVLWSKVYDHNSSAVDAIQLNNSFVLVGASGNNPSGQAYAYAPQIDCYLLKIYYDGTSSVGSKTLPLTFTSVLSDTFPVTIVHSSSFFTSSYFPVAAGASTTFDSVSCVGVGIPGHADPKLSCWPNPTNDIVRIKGISENNICKIEIYDLQGKNVKVTRSTPNVDVRDLMPGFYFLRIIFDTGSVVNLRFLKE